MKIDNKVYSLDCTSSGRCFCVKEADGYTLIDTGMPKLTKDIMKELLSYGIEPQQIKRILLTHGDVDHIGNVEHIRKITQCEVYADNIEIPYLEKRERYNWLKGLFKTLLRIKPILNVKPLPEKQIGELTIIKSPGHTPGHVCYKFGKYLFIGDLIGVAKGKIRLLPKKMTFDVNQLLNSIKTLDISGVEIICPAHRECIKAIPTWNNFVKTLNQN